MARPGAETRKLETLTAHCARKRNFDPRWLLLALLVHALLLCLPLARFSEPARASRALPVQISLLPPPGAPDSPDAHEPPDQSEPAVVPAAPPARLTAARAAELPAARSLNGDEARADDASPVLHSTARLMDLARSSRLSPHPGHERMLGSAPPRGADTVADGPRATLGAALARSYAPPAPEIVDRWLAADGSHQVVVRLPNGDTVCGRGEAWDPLRPLVEPVMMFRDCGGGGARSFTMSADARPAYSIPD